MPKPGNYQRSCLLWLEYHGEEIEVLCEGTFHIGSGAPDDPDDLFDFTVYREWNNKDITNSLSDADYESLQREFTSKVKL